MHRYMTYEFKVDYIRLSTKKYDTDENVGTVSSSDLVVVVTSRHCPWFGDTYADVYRTRTAVSSDGRCAPAKI